MECCFRSVSVAYPALQRDGIRCGSVITGEAHSGNPDRGCARELVRVVLVLFFSRLGPQHLVVYTHRSVLSFFADISGGNVAADVVRPDHGNHGRV